MKRSQLMDAAVDLVATEGLAGLTMAATARAVGLSEMGLYRHVAKRDELVALVVGACLDRILSDGIDIPEHPPEARAGLIELAHRLASGFPRYPDTAAHLAVHGPRSPASLRHMASILRLLARAGVPTGLLGLAQAHYTSTICSVAIFRQHVTTPGQTAWGAEATELLAQLDQALGPELAGVAATYTGDVDAYQRYAIGRCVDAILTDATG